MWTGKERTGPTELHLQAIWVVTEGRCVASGTLTRSGDYLIVPLFWKYENITRSGFTGSTGTRNQAQNLSAVGSTRSDWPCGRRNSSTAWIAKPDAVVSFECSCRDRTSTAA